MERAFGSKALELPKSLFKPSRLSGKKNHLFCEGWPHSILARNFKTSQILLFKTDRKFDLALLESSETGGGECSNVAVSGW